MPFTPTAFAMGESSLEIIQNPHDDRWVAFITDMPQANFFHHPAWMTLIADCYGYRPWVVAIRNQNGEILAGLPMMEIKGLLQSHRWVSLPFSDHCSPLYRDQASLDALAGGLVKLYHDRRIPRMEVRWELPGQPTFQPSASYAWHTLGLNQDFTRVSKGFDRVHKQNVRQAEDHQIEVRWGSELKDFRAYYELQLATRRRHGVPAQPWRYFQLFYEHLVRQGYSSVLLAYQGDQCIAGLVLLHWQQTIIFKYAASREETMKLRPNNLLFWTAIRWGCENGYTLLDFGRSDLDNPGLSRFKRGWGAEETMLHYTTLSARPPGQASGRLLKLVKPVIQKSPAWVCQAVGELLYQYSA